MDINFIVKLTSRAWSLEILSLMNKGIPGRQAPLLAASNAGRTAFAQSLVHLIELGLLEKNPGHGHPLRPEYRLTPLGKTVAAQATQITKIMGTDAQAAIIRKNWTIPILALSNMPRHFSDYKLRLPSITDRALSLSLQRLNGLDWLERHIDPGTYPPRPRYKAINHGALIGEVINSARL